MKAGCYGCIVEHYTSEWQPDPDKNRDADPSSEEYIFRPFGFQPGHSFEWAKLLLLIESHHKKLGTKEEEIAWVLPAAELLFETAYACGWDIERGGAYYTFDNKGKVNEVSILSGPSMNHEWVKMSIVHTRPRQNEYFP